MAGGGLRRAVTFLTPLGGGGGNAGTGGDSGDGGLAPDPATLCWFPLVGAVIGLAVGGVWWAGGELWPPAVSAALVVVADLALTGLLHVDGVVDSADGLLPPLERSRRLEVMADPAAGAFGVLAAVAVLLCRFAALASMSPTVWLIVALWCTSRVVMVAAVRWLPYARTGGLASAFIGGRRRGVAVGVTAAMGALGALALAVVDLGVAGAAAVVGCWAGAAAVLLLGHRRLGGYTGDVVGAAAVVGETVGLVVGAARW